ncbi:MAG: UPF0158 family protein [Candidatus Aenigmarchaeota archaeon]|nr:UPF0158 family protein [Candidatus Aenigmarchaeota archaeon]
MKVDTSKIDMDELIFALQTHFESLTSYLDLKTGKVLTFGEEEEELIEKIEKNVPERYVYIEPIPSSISYGWMEEFIEMVEDENLREKLEIAIDGPGAFRRFKNVLLGYPEVRERWFEFERKKLEEYAKDWLESLRRE